MIHVIVTVCIAGTAVMVDPHDLDKEKTCRTVEKVFQEDISKITPYACMQNAAKLAGDWLEKNPGYTTRMLRCKPYKGGFGGAI
jgi:hypothetical protein